MYPEPEPDAYERFIYSQGIYAPFLDRNEENRTMEFGARQRKARAGMDIDASD